MERLEKMREELSSELSRNLEYWKRVSFQPETGRFLTLGCDNQPLESGRRSGVLICRVLWAFSSAYRLTGSQTYLSLAEAAFEDICGHYLDKEKGGCLEGLSAMDEPWEEDKRTYTQCYLIYGMSEYFLATAKPEAREIARQTYELLQREAYEEKSGTYRTHLSSHPELNELDTALHAMEAFASLYRIWPDEGLKESLKGVLRVFAGRFLKEDGGLYPLLSPDFAPLDASDRYADDAEGCWMFLEAALALGEEGILSCAKRAAGRIMGHVYEQGLDMEYGGVFDRGYEEGEKDTEKMWWEESESILGFLYAAWATGEERFAKAALDTWAFMKRAILDPEGEWNWRVTREGEKIWPLDPADPLKCPYHSTRLATLGCRMLDDLVKL